MKVLRIFSVTSVLIATKPELRAALRVRRHAGASLAFVPTMGALHEGHLSLIRAAAQGRGGEGGTENPAGGVLPQTGIPGVSPAPQAGVCVVVSIFVNPMQFAPGEDFARYPRDQAADVDAALAAGADIVFAPTREELYPPGLFLPVIDPGALARRWEGACRPGHFAGVALIVSKLLNIVSPDCMYVGEKDYQQYRVLEALVAALDIPTEVILCPTLRAADGLALSSRNRFLTDDERCRAAALPQALGACRGKRQSGAPVSEIELAAREILGAAGLAPDYAALVDPVTLEPLTVLKGGQPARLLLAARLGTVRLLDSAAL
jgi:pantoate--beta-alanine ligase